VKPSKIDGSCSFCGAKKAEVGKLNQLTLLVALGLGRPKVRPCAPA